SPRITGSARCHAGLSWRLSLQWYWCLYSGATSPSPAAPRFGLLGPQSFLLAWPRGKCRVGPEYGSAATLSSPWVRAPPHAEGPAPRPPARRQLWASVVAPAPSPSYR